MSRPGNAKLMKERREQTRHLIAGRVEREAKMAVEAGISTGAMALRAFRIFSRCIRSNNIDDN
jgi:uncharacterized protein YutE (UPF0331/DUF86 family)